MKWVTRLCGLVAVLSISGCWDSKQQTLAECKFDAIKHDRTYDRDGWQFVNLCMETKGYEAKVERPSTVCPLFKPYYDVNCYVATTWLGKLSEKLR
jgi:hypothetical protein